jgi:general secretion pathway protein J
MKYSRRRSQGFTLIEVLVALVVMATMAIMSWRGLDALLKTRDIAQTHLDQSARLQTVMAQWEQDLRSIQDSGVVDPLSFDGGSLRITRQQPLGLQVVSWSVRNGRLYRWESAPVQTVAALEQNVQRGQQQLAQESQQLRALEGVSGWQLYCYRGNSWSNCLSSADVVSVTVSASASPPAPTASGPVGTAPNVGPQRAALPTGVRMVLQFDAGSGFGGPLTRQIALGPT